ncbi:MAG TPA: fumarylacetoacetate hydrolase family protein [Paracoccaceae bacterium]|nr:fumarylacetoacetate hydrolase family protein [Paracoccaceae bacterium]
MTIELNPTHDPARRSWVEAANAPETDFPIQNLPFGVFSTGGAARGGVALGDRIIDLCALMETGLLTGEALVAAQVASGPTLAPLFACDPAAVSALRSALSDLFRADGPVDRAMLEQVLVPMVAARMEMPLRPPAFTDFCTSIDHIRRMAGGQVKGAALALPVAYNGRASSVYPSGTAVVRPNGQFALPPGSENVQFGPEPMLDFELEFGAWLRGGNRVGEPISMAQAEASLFGCCLVNDWSARGIQFFESILGPHLGKSFLTTISPWVVTMEALAPFRTAARGRDEGEPAVPAYMADAADRQSGAINVELTAHLATSTETSMGTSTQIVTTNLNELFWTLAQMVAHQASNGAPLESGDLIATGTVSGAAPEARACLIELTEKGTVPLTLSDGSTRIMLEDDDTLTIKGRAMAEGFVSIGFGDCSGTITPARSTAWN